MNHPASQEALESLLKNLCSSVELSQTTEMQTLYHLMDQAGAKLAHDLLATYGFHSKLYPDNNTSRLYVENSSLTAEKLPFWQQALAESVTVRSIRTALGNDSKAKDAQIHIQNTMAGHQITIQFPQENPSHSPAAAPQKASPIATQQPPAPHKFSKKPLKKSSTEEEFLSSGPAVKRKDLPKSLTVDGQNEDGVVKRAMLFSSSHFMLGGSTFVFFCLCLGVILSVLVVIRSFVCYDIATVKNPAWYCHSHSLAKPKNEQSQ